MTEAEWPESATAVAMIRYLRDRASDRKFRLYAAACCRFNMRSTSDRREAPYSVAEAFADDRATLDEVREQWGGNATTQSWPEQPWQWATSLAKARSRSLSRTRSRLVRDVFANPFRPIAFDPAWRTPDVTALAQAAYEERLLPKGELDPLRLAVLADALEEVGANEAIVTHLRSGGPHVRGCWAADLCLAKM
jgi:hypothetical protein